VKGFKEGVKDGAGPDAAASDAQSARTIDVDAKPKS
jgi:hypothetical protein